MTKEQSKAHWFIVENHPNFTVSSTEKYFEICDIVFNALKEGQKLPIHDVIESVCEHKNIVDTHCNLIKYCPDCNKEFE